MNRPAGNIQYGGFGARLLAVIIDTLLLAPLSLVIQSAQMGLFYQALLGVVFSGVYYVMFLSGSWQATPGKRILNLYVTDYNGQPINHKQATVRYLAYIMPTLPLYSSIGPEAMNSLIMLLMLGWFVPILFTDEKTGAHDMLARTRVRIGRPN